MGSNSKVHDSEPSEKHHFDKTEQNHHHDHDPKNCDPKFPEKTICRILPGRRRGLLWMDFISLILTVSEIILVTWLSITHFNHSRGLVACIMMGPMVLNFVGVMYFFSNKRDNRDFEKYCTGGWDKDLFQFPFVGSVFMALHTLSLSCGCAKGKGKTFHDYERFESLNVKMKQADTFFKGAVEVKIQILILLIIKFEHGFTYDGVLALVVILLLLISLAESNMNGILSNYYRMFHDYEPNDWQLPEIRFLYKIVLFVHAFTSIAVKLLATCMFRAAVIYALLSRLVNDDLLGIWSNLIANDYFRHRNTSSNGHQEVNATIEHHIERRAAPAETQGESGEHDNPYGGEMAAIAATILLVTVAFELKFRNMVYYITRIIKYKLFLRRKIPHGCYDSIMFSWRATILDFNYLSHNAANVISFYVEVILSFVYWTHSLFRFADVWHQTYLFPVVSSVYFTCLCLSWVCLGLLIAFGLHHIHRPCRKRHASNAGSDESHEVI